MKNKNLFAIGFVLVAVLIGYFKFFHKEPPHEPLIKSETPFTDDIFDWSTSRDSFRLLSLGKDPFSTKSSREPKPKKTLSKSKRKERPRLPNISKNIELPPIEYLGLLSNDNGDEALGLIRLNGQLKKVRQNQILLDEIQIKKFDEKSLALLFNDEIIYFSR